MDSACEVYLSNKTTNLPSPQPPSSLITHPPPIPPHSTAHQHSQPTPPPLHQHTQVWCVPVPKPGSRVPAVCKPSAIREQLQLVLALQVCSTAWGKNRRGQRRRVHTCMLDLPRS